MLAPVDGEPLIRRVARAFRESPADEVLVVVGAHAEALEAALAGLPVRVVRHAGWAAGMLSSVRAGLAAADSRATHVAISPADLPGLTPAIVARVLAAIVRPGGPGAGATGAAARERRASLAVVVPAFQGHRGHPLVAPRSLLARVLTWGDERRLSDLLREPDVEVVELEGFGPEVLRDVDVPADLEPAR